MYIVEKLLMPNIGTVQLDVVYNFFWTFRIWYSQKLGNQIIRTPPKSLCLKNRFPEQKRIKKNTKKNTLISLCSEKVMKKAAAKRVWGRMGCLKGRLPKSTPSWRTGSGTNTFNILAFSYKLHHVRKHLLGKIQVITEKKSFWNFSRARREKKTRPELPWELLSGVLATRKNFCVRSQVCT